MDVSQPPNHLKLNSEFLPVQQIIQALQESWSMLMASVEISGDLIHSDDTVVRTKKENIHQLYLSICDILGR